MWRQRCSARARRRRPVRTGPRSSTTSRSRFASRTSRGVRWSRGRSVCGSRPPGLCHTDIHAAHGDWPVKPSPPFVPGHEGVGIVEELGSGVIEVATRRARRAAVARLRVRDVRLLRVRLGDALPRAEEHGLLDRRRLRRVRDRVRAVRRQGSRRSRPVRRGAADVRRRHDVQGDQGRRDAVVGPRRGVRRRRPRPHGDPVRPHRGRTGRSRSTCTTRSSSSHGSSAPSSR